MDIINNRKPDASVNKMFIERWSPRAFSDKPVEQEKLDILFEASRWAPSCYNDQPWMYVYADSEETLPAFRELLVEQNRVWADKAPVLAIIFARKKFTFNDNVNDWAEFDAGSAWMSLALQARELGLYAHAMAGFYKDKACEALGVPAQEYTPCAAIAIGYPGSLSGLPEQLAKNESPNERRPASSFVHNGKYGK